MKLMDLNSVILSDLLHRKGFTHGQNNFHLLSSEEKYISRVTKISQNFYHSIDQIHFIKTFLKRFPCKEFYKKNDINQLTYMT